MLISLWQLKNWHQGENVTKLLRSDEKLNQNSYKMVTLFQNHTINVALYSCDWTEMNIKFKKLLILKMQINNANSYELNVSTNIIVN